jgi:hypothetical protein
MGAKGSAEEFMRDLDAIVSKIFDKLDQQHHDKIRILRDDLVSLYRQNKVKINHSVMELVCAMHLIEAGFEVRLETAVDGISTDVYGEKGLGSLMVEVETGFVSPENALDPLQYLKGRSASKITRYSSFANKFVLATPPYYILQIPPSLTKPPRFRTDEECVFIKKLCDLYYKNPPVTLEEIKNARLHSIYVIDVDNVQVKEWEVNEYMGKASLWLT